ncbi:N utilization substance protein B [Agaricicola taiwanensis]|uniref:Transcription antitermination protein NusB n=1 Tax=Agaricicola taiwanensis TaxID=591372 RepID=A0A8J2YJ91_9RHOB|nr:transcription antitermination factor NusB [Agaricicola taiwanensis]GGE46347.1 N utilization substance protein B [Agaricicola taiwanensis]
MAKGEKRSAARLGAVQALYQMDLTGAGIADVFAEFESHWLGKEVEGHAYKPAEAAFFRAIVSGVLDHQRALDQIIDKTLAAGWPLRRVEAILRAILRAGAFEIIHRRDIPAKVIISEYADVASAFFERDEVGLANAVLDTIARGQREDELKTRVG